jgi:hypothetical protein
MKKPSKKASARFCSLHMNDGYYEKTEEEEYLSVAHF